MGRIGDPGIIPNLLELSALESRKLNYEEQELKTALITTLGELNDNSALPALRRALTDPEYEIRKAAIDALYSMDTPEAT